MKRVPHSRRLKDEIEELFRGEPAETPTAEDPRRPASGIRHRSETGLQFPQTP